MSTTRREFLSISGSALAGSALAGFAGTTLAATHRSQPEPAKPAPAKPGANAIGIGIIGMGKRAIELLDPLLNRSDCRVAAVCDVDTTRREAALARVDKHYGSNACKHFVDYQELLAMPEIKAVVICTPDHWHANQVIHAAKAKKDIYCEKPLTHCLAEARPMIGAVKKHQVVFQTGSQQRTEYDHRFVQAAELVRNGRVGKLLTVHVGVGVSSKPCDLPTNEKPEPGLDWDRWLGPAPKRAYHPDLSPRGVHSHYPSWRLYSEYSGGMMTDFGAHNFDIMQWALGMDESGPMEVIPPSDPAAEYGCKLIYASGVEVIHGGPAGITFTGTEGTLHVWRDRTVSIPDSIVKKPLPDSAMKLPRHKSHLDNWFDCIRSRQTPVCGVEVGARSNACAHLCNIAYAYRKPLKWDPRAWEFIGDAAANALLERTRRSGYELPGS